MKKLKIKSRYSDNILFESEANSIKELLIKAVNSGAYLHGADLSGADLRGADLIYADLIGADLRGADLIYADLIGADLRGADLRGADLSGADLRGAKIDISKIKFMHQIIPEEGNFIAWKKVNRGLILKLEIHKSAKRTCNIKNRKCRASKVKTLEIQNVDGTKADVKEAVGLHNNNTIYKIGKVTYPDSYDDDFLNDCTNGIHFFITRQEAVNW